MLGIVVAICLALAGSVGAEQVTPVWSTFPYFNDYGGLCLPVKETFAKMGLSWKYVDTVGIRVKGLGTIESFEFFRDIGLTDGSWRRSVTRYSISAGSLEDIGLKVDYQRSGENKRYIGKLMVVNSGRKYVISVPTDIYAISSVLPAIAGRSLGEKLGKTVEVKTWRIYKNSWAGYTLKSTKQSRGVRIVDIFHKDNGRWGYCGRETTDYLGVRRGQWHHPIPLEIKTNLLTKLS